MIYCFESDSKLHHEWYNNRKQNDIVYMLNHYDLTRTTRQHRWAKILSLNPRIDIELTDEVNKWMKEHDICYPFRNKEEEVLFELTFG